jgi:ParB/RepB/Spo0J family partition protein
MSDLRNIPLSAIRESEVALRGVDVESEEFLGLRDSIKATGLLSPISVRRREENVDGKVIEYFEIVDGLQRYTACAELGLDEVAVNVVDFDKVQVLEAQIMANVHKIETRPVEYTKQLQRLFAYNPTWTLADMAGRLAKSASWVQQRLGLLKLEPQIQALVDDGKISVANAVALSKLPHEEQVNFVDQAMTMGVQEFAPTIKTRSDELAKAKREGRKAEPAVFTPVASLRKPSEIKDELANPYAGPELVKQTGATTALEGFALAIAYVLHLDPISVAAQKAADDEKKGKIEEAKRRRAAERAAKKAAEAADEAAKAQAAIEG